MTGIVHILVHIHSPERIDCRYCYITAMVFGVYHGVRTFIHVYFS